MKVLFESRDPEGSELRAVAVKRLRFVLRRFTWLVPRARIELSDINGPRGGIDKHCRVELKTERSGKVVVSSLARDWNGALNAALARASRVLVRVWRRSRSHAPARRLVVSYER